MWKSLLSNQIIAKISSLTNKLKSLCKPGDVILANKEVDEFIANPRYNRRELKTKLNKIIKSYPNAVKSEMDNTTSSILDVCDILMEKQLKFGRSAYLSCCFAHLFCISRFFMFHFNKHYKLEETKDIVYNCLYEPKMFFFKQIVGVLLNYIPVLLLGISDANRSKNDINFDMNTKNGFMDYVDGEYSAEIVMMDIYLMYYITYTILSAVTVIVKYNIINKELKKERPLENNIEIEDIK